MTQYDDFSTEEWRPVVGFEGMYDVSDFGRVRSLISQWGNPRNPPKILKTRLHSEGYLRVALAKDGKHYDKYIHIIVMESFSGPRPDGLEVNHDDGVKANNRLSNLKYVTHRENVMHSVRTGLREPGTFAVPGSRNGRAKLTEDVIPLVREMAENQRVERVAAHFGVSKAVVYKIHRRKLWKHVA